MITEDQHAVIAFLMQRSTHGGAAVERLETHASIVFLAGDRALKLKRAVRYDYLDFSTAERRRAMCEAEVRINRRTAPSIYRGVVAVARKADGTLALGDAGTPVDWLVEMRRFDQDGLFDRLAERGVLDLALMDPLAEAIAAFHEAAEPRRDHGGRAGMAWVIDGNAASFGQEGGGILDPDAARRVTDRSRHALDRLAAALDARRDAGLVRQCHGDLHLRNIVLLDGRPTLFDGIEFNDEIACIDVLYDLAFLLMDLWRRRLPAHAHRVWNAYLRHRQDIDGIALLPLFLSCRAAVRAKTSATAAGLQSEAARGEDLKRQAREYLDMAARLLAPPAPSLVAIGGLSGSGKSTVAYGIGPAIGAVPGAVVIRSDEIRKQVCGVPPLTRLGPDAYAPAVSQRVYAMMGERAAAVVGQGHAVVVDAVFARPADRAAIEAVARTAGVPFQGIWLEAPPATLLARAGHRTRDASDADAAVVRAQLTHDTGPVAWHRIDASAQGERVIAEVLGVVR